MPEALAVVAHQVHGGKVGLARHVAIGQGAYDGVTLDPPRELDHEHEPAAPAPALVRAGELEFLDPPERFPGETSHPVPAGQEHLQPFKLAQPERAGDVREAVVEAEA